MGISSTGNREVYTGDGLTGSFSFPFYFSSDVDLKVYIYEILTGLITLQANNTDYLVTGSQNAQGIYTSGGTVTLFAAPTSSEQVVIYRDPSRVQNYALLQNGAISSTALVQQLDYLTLLVQRLEDQISRAVILPDGIGATFSGALPDTTVLNPGSFLAINGGGTGISLVSSPLAGFNPVTKVYTDFQTAGTVSHVKIFTLPAGYMLTRLVLKHSASFTGSSISAVQAQIGIASDYSKFMDNYNALQATGATVFDGALLSYIGSFSTDTDIYLTLNSTGANLSALAAGSITAYYTYLSV